MEIAGLALKKTEVDEGWTALKEGGFLYGERTKKPRQRIEALTGACNRATSSQVVLKRSTVLGPRWKKIERQRSFLAQLVSNMPASARRASESAGWAKSDGERAGNRLSAVEFSIRNKKAREHRASRASPWGKWMRAAIRFGLLMVALLSAPRPAEADPKIDRWEKALTNARSLIQARIDDVRALRKETDELVEALNKIGSIAKLKPEIKSQLAQKRLYIYTRLGGLNAAAVELEQTLPNKVAPIARQKVVDMLTRLRDELRFTVVSLNHVGRTLKEL